LASEEKVGRLKQLMDSGKEKGYVLYDEVNELLTDEFATGGRELDDLLSDLDTAGVEILEEPKVEFDKKLEEGEEPTDLDLVQDFSDKTNDPVRMYLREMGTVPLLTREAHRAGPGRGTQVAIPFGAGDSRDSGSGRGFIARSIHGARHLGDAGPGGDR
jgi:hypothetical protein